MTMMLRTVFLLAVVAAITTAQDPDRRKAACPPADRVNLSRRNTGRDNYYRRACVVRGERRDTCRKRMSCCENSQGEMLCIRARLYSPRFRPEPAIQTPAFPPMVPPPMNNMMQNDMEIMNSHCPVARPGGKSCNIDFGSTPCFSDFDCVPGRICCADPCTSGLLPNLLCLVPVKSNLNELPPNPFGQDPFSQAPFQQQTSGNVPPSVPTTENTPPAVPKETPTAEAPSSAALIVETPTEKINPVTPKVTQRASPTTSNIEKATIPNASCPKKTVPKKCNPDGTECAIACASFDASHTSCESDSHCADGRICCEDPCPGSQLKLCFPAGSGSKDNAVVPPGLQQQ